MANKPPDVRLTGIRASIPPGYLLGRVSAGIGGVELISVGKAQSAGLIPSTMPGPPTGAAGGDLSGTYPNPTVAQLQGVAVAAGTPTNLAVLLYHTAGATWLPIVLGAVAYTNAYSDLSGLPTLPTGANPTATGSDVAVNGVATTFMRSDGAPAIQKGSSSVFGLVKVDGTTITSVGGVISSVGGGSSASGAASIQDDGTNLYIAMSDTDGQLVLDGGGDPIFSKEVLPATSIPVDGTTIQAVGGFISQVLNTLPAFSADLNGVNQAVGAGTALINLSHVSFDTRGWFDTVNHRYKPLVAGKYVIIGYSQPVESAIAAGDGAETFIFKNGAFLAGGTSAQSIGTGTGSLVFTIVDMNGTTDYVDLQAYGTANRTAIRGLAAQTYMCGFLLPSKFNS